MRYLSVVSERGRVASAWWYNMTSSVKQLTLVMLHCGERILLGLKKRGFGAGKINVRRIRVLSTPNITSSRSIFPQGFGGKVEAGESVYDAALRELQEEAGVHASDATKCGVIRFEFEGDPVALQVHVYRTPPLTYQLLSCIDLTPISGTEQRSSLVSACSFLFESVHSLTDSLQELWQRATKCGPSGMTFRASPTIECG